MSTFLDDLQQWVELDVAAWALGRALGVFAPDARLTDVKGVLWTNNTVGNTLYGMLERLARLGVLECDEAERRYRSAVRRLHPLDARIDVPALAAGPPDRAHVAWSADDDRAVRLEADRAGCRYLARVFDDIADSGVESGWGFGRDAAFRAAGDAPGFRFALVDPEMSDETDPQG